MSHNHATPVGEEKSERRQYHDRTNLPLMVSLLFALQRAGNTMKNTIDNADCIIDWIVLIIAIQCVRDSCHSHSIVNKPLFYLIINSLIVVVGGDTMKNTILRNYLSSDTPSVPHRTNQMQPQLDITCYKASSRRAFLKDLPVPIARLKTPYRESSSRERRECFGGSDNQRISI